MATIKRSTEEVRNAYHAVARGLQAYYDELETERDALAAQVEKLEATVRGLSNDSAQPEAPKPAPQRWRLLHVAHYTPAIDRAYEYTVVDDHGHSIALWCEGWDSAEGWDQARRVCDALNAMEVATTSAP